MGTTWPEDRSILTSTRYLRLYRVPKNAILAVDYPEVVKIYLCI